MPRPMNRGALADMRATAKRLERERDAQWKADLAWAREHRTPKGPPVMPDVKVGDRIRPVIGNNLLTVVKVNRKSVVTEGGSRWVAGEFEVTA